MKALKTIEAISQKLGLSPAQVINKIRTDYMESEREALTLEQVKENCRDDGVLSGLEKYELGWFQEA